MQRRRRIAACLLGALAASASAAAGAQDYPTRPIRFVVAFTPGGAADLLARVLGQRLAERWNQQVVIDNRGGAGGVVGMGIAAKAAPDGYTILMGSSSTFAISPALHADLPYHPLKSFTAIAQAAVVPIILVVHPSVPARSVAELVQHARANPGQLRYASSGAGATPHISGELFRRAAGIDLVHVPYKGGGDAVAAVLGGHVQMSFGAVSTSLPHMRSGRLRALGVTSAKRLAAVPEVPTIAEGGLAGYEVVQWFGVFAPAGVPRPIVERLSAEIGAIIGSDEVRNRFSSQGVEPLRSDSRAFSTYVAAEVAKWGRLLKEMGIGTEQVR